MKFKDYFIKAKSYFIAIIIIALFQTLASVLALYPKLGLLDPVSLISLGIVVHAGYKLKLASKNSAILGMLLFASKIWYVLFAMPYSMLTLGLTTVLIIALNVLINVGIYALAAFIGSKIKKRKAYK